VRTQNTPLTDWNLFFSSIKGSRTAFRRIVSRYAPMVQAEICAILPEQAPYAKELTRAIFKEVHRHLPRLRKPVRLGRWIMALTRRACSTVLERKEQAARRGSIGKLLDKYLDRLSAGSFTLFEKALLPLSYFNNRNVRDLIYIGRSARFGTIRYARKIPVRPCAIGPLAGMGGKLVKIPLRTRRIFYYNVVAGMSLGEISQMLRISPAAVSTRLLRCLLALGALPKYVKTKGFAFLRMLAQLPAVALGEGSLLNLRGPEVQASDAQFGHILDHLGPSLLRYREEAKLAKLNNSEIEKLLFELPRMILSPGSAYRWNVKVEPRKRRLFPVTVSVAVHVVLLVIMSLSMLTLAGRRKPVPFINAYIGNYRQAQRFKDHPRDKAPEEKVKPSEAEAEREGVELPGEDKLADTGFIKQILENYEPSVELYDRPRNVSWPAPFERHRGRLDRRGHGDGEGEPAKGGTPVKTEVVDEERLERIRQKKLESIRKFHEECERRVVLTQCFAVLDSIAYDKKEAFSSLSEAANYVNGNFFKDLSEKVARKCRKLGYPVTEGKVREMWENRKRVHSRSVYLGVAGTRLIEYRTTNWSGAHPLTRKNVIEYLIAKKYCEIKSVRKEPCWRCGGTGYLLKTGMKQKTGERGMFFYRIPCPICKGLRYELVVTYK